MNLINKKAVRKYALEVSKEFRSGKFNRVSAEFLTELNEKVRILVFNSVKNHQTKGKTITNLRDI